jgi:fucose 4-O-acetylase-like acetyltransferase
MVPRALNIEISILKALGIMAVVVSHHLNPEPAFFPPNSFHIALFMFAAGYFHSTQAEERPVRYLLKRVVWLLTIFYPYHLYHALEHQLLWDQGIRFGNEPPLFPELLYSFALFKTYGLGFPMWFVMQLFVSQCLLLLVRWALRVIGPNETPKMLFFLALGIAAIALAEAGYNQDRYSMIALRTVLCMCFLHMGFFYRTTLEGKIPFTGKAVMGVVVLQAILTALYGSVAYTVGSMTFFDHTLLPLVVACTGIYMCLFFAKVLAPHVDANHILCRIGNNTFHISAMHMSFGFIAVLLLRWHFGETEPITSPLYGYDMGRFWALYVTLGVLGPVFLIEGLRAAKVRLRTAWGKYNTR